MVASFTDQSTGVIDSRSWDFGDGGSSTDQNPTHTYAAHGAYTVTLTVSGPGGSDTESQTVTINPPAPAASFTAQPLSGTIPLTVTFTSTSTGLVDTAAWDLDGDGVFDDATGPTASRTFDTAGDHTVGLSVTGPGGTSTTSQTVVAKLPPAPVASFTATPSTGTAPVTVNFDDTSTGVITSRSWDFDGDGVTDDTGATPSHVFSSPGVYQVYLTVTGPGGNSTTSQAITVNANTPPVITITAPANGATFTVGTAVTFSGTANDAQDGNLSSGIAWSSSADGPLGTGASIQVSSLFVGSHTITASVADTSGSPVSASVNIIVTPAPPAAPVASFTRIPSGGGFAPLTVNFTDTSTGTITSRSWTFGDGGTSTEQNPTHTYDAGAFMITLTVTGPGGSDSFSQPILVASPGDPGDCGGRRCEPPPTDDSPPSGLP